MAMEHDPDIIVVGGGSAGCAVARRLADACLRVLLIEAGKSDRTWKSLIPAMVGGVVNDPNFDWCYKAEPDPSVGGRVDVWPAGKRLGGGSAINGMMFIRGHPFDYDRWAQLGATGWDYQSVLPYFRRLEDNERGADAWRGSGGPIAVSEVRSRYPVTQAWIEAVQEAGFPRSRDLNGECAEGVDFIQLSQRDGLRCSAATGYLTGTRNNLRVLLEREVEKIIVENGRAAGVAFREGPGIREIRAKAGVVLSAGSLNTPRMLMLSGIGPAEHLRSNGLEVLVDSPGVGQNLQEHVGTHLVNEVEARTLNAEVKGLAGVAQLAKFAFSRSGALTTGIGHAQAFLRTRDGLPAPNVQLAYSAFAFDVTATGSLALRDRPSVSTFVALMRPTSRGKVMLAGPLPQSPPRIEYRLLDSEDDLTQLVEGLELAQKIMRQPAIAGAVTNEVRPGVPPSDGTALNNYVRMASLPMYHPVGTARMGARLDPLAVLDKDLAVRGVDGLWVADASAMPTIPSGNTNATAIMIGDKASDHILRRLN